MEGLTLGYPLALFGLLVLPVVYVVHRWRPLHPSSWGRRSALILRLAAITALVLTLARPAVLRPLDALDVVFALDASSSMASARAAELGWVDQALSTMPSTDRAGVVSFGSEAQLLKALNHSRELPELPGVDDQTSIGAGIRAATSLFDRPALKRVIVLSDGAENLGTAEDVARRAGGQGIQVSAVPFLPADGLPEVLIESMDSPARVREGEPVETTLVIYSTVDAEVTLRFWKDEKLVSEDAIRLEPGPNRFVYDQGSALPKGFHSFRARVDPPPEKDTIKENNELSSFTVVGDRGRVLLVESQPGQGSGLADLLRQERIDVDVAAPTSIPSKLAPIRQYDALVMFNVPATMLSADQMKAIQSYVQVLGKGLIAIGGKDSFGLGGYANTPLEETLPVSMTPPAKRDNPSLALLLVVDKTGSMDMPTRSDSGSRTTKMAMAQQAAILAMDVLKPNDQLGIIQFDMKPQWVVPFTSLGDPAAKQRARDRINAIKADGGTEIFPALQMAIEATRLTQAQLKHIVLLTDGREFSQWDYDPLVTQLRNAGITLSTIAIGSDADTQLLKKLADQGKGRYYLADDERNVPKILTREATTASADRLVEADFKPKVTAASPILRNFVGDAVPDLSGYVATTPKPGAQVDLASPQDDPVLAQWQYGLGRAVAFLSTLDSNWAPRWLAWGDAPRFWAQTVRWAMPSPLDGNVQLSVDLQGKMARLKVDAVDDAGAYANLIDTQAQVRSAAPAPPDRVSIELSQTAPGRYEGSYTAPGPGAYVVQIVQKQGGQTIRDEIFGFVVPYSPELRLNRDGSALLQRIAVAGGGTVLQTPTAAFRRTGHDLPLDRVDLWPYFLSAALILFPLDLAVRRLWPR